MSKNKKLQYILIAVVFTIWGLVIYRIFFEGVTKPENLTQILKPILKESEETKPKKYKLIANYRDPFLSEVQSNEVKQNEEVNQEDVNQTRSNLRRRRTSVSRVRWPEIKYNGFIENKNNKYTILLQIKNRDYLAYTGDTIEQILIKEFYKDSLIVEFSKEEKTLVK